MERKTPHSTSFGSASKRRKQDKVVTQEGKSPAESKTRKKRASTVGLTFVEAKNLLGRVFYRSLFSRISCLTGSDVYRIVGWTKSRKRLIVEEVPLTEEPGDSKWMIPHQNRWVDVKWLDSHPIQKPQTSGGKQAIYEKRLSNDGKQDEYLFMEGDFFHPLPKPL